MIISSTISRKAQTIENGSFQRSDVDKTQPNQKRVSCHFSYFSMLVNMPETKKTFGRAKNVFPPPDHFKAFKSSFEPNKTLLLYCYSWRESIYKSIRLISQPFLHWESEWHEARDNTGHMESFKASDGDTSGPCLRYLLGKSKPWC